MEQIKTNKMSTKPILPLLLSMGFPPMCSMMVQSLYNIVDSMFVARISEDALTAVSLAFPIQFFILAASLGVGVGTNSYISRKLGEKQPEKANQAATHAIVLTLINYLIFVILGLFCLEPFFRMFSDSEVIIGLGLEYTNVIVFFCLAAMVQIAIEKILQSTGKMILPMVTQIIGAVTNIILDPILIFGLFGAPAMGVKGAAVATVIGQSASMIFAICIMVWGKHDVKIRFKGFKFETEIVKQIYVVGVPTMMMNALGSVLIMGLNSILSSFSNMAVSVFGIYFKLQSFVYMPVSGLIQGAMPILGYNFGANDKERFLKTIKCSIGVTLLIMTCGTILFWTCSDQLLSLFNASEEMIEMGRLTLRVISIGYIPATIGFIFATAFQAMGRGMYSLMIFLLRQLIVALPVAFILAPIMGLVGVWMAFPIAEFSGAIVSSLLFAHVYKKEPIFHQGNKERKK